MEVVRNQVDWFIHVSFMIKSCRRHSFCTVSCIGDDNQCKQRFFKAVVVRFPNMDFQ